MRSVSQPQNWRLTNALPSKTDSISAPWAGAIPKSLQRATRWVGGMAIGVQHRNPAKHRRANVIREESRRSGSRICRWCSDAELIDSGAGRKSISAARPIATVVAMPNANMVTRHPKCAIPSAMQGGHSAPAMYCPLETNATAEPRRRSNQRLM